MSEPIATPGRRTLGGARSPRARFPGAILALAASFALLASCAGTTAGQVDARAERRRAPRTTTTAGPDCAQMLPPEARAAQLILAMVTTPEVAQKALDDGIVGGFALKGNQSKDIGSSVAATVKDAPITPFVASDEEGGTVQRLRLALGDLPAAATVAKGTSEEAAKTAGEHAKGMKQLGFNVNFAPVADVGSGAGLGTRSYGSDPATVSSFVDAVFPAISDAGVMPVVKHWPGIGGGSADPHQQVTKLAPIDTLRTKDLIPFEDAIAKGAPAIMVTHAEVPGLTARGEPASLSSAAITGELRGREGFTGLVFTDSLGMGAITQLGSQTDAAEKAIAAGADVAMISGVDVAPAVHARLVDAITTGRIPADQVLASVRRVLAAKGVEGPCLDAVARYSALARSGSTVSSTAPGATASSTPTTVGTAGAGTTPSRMTTTSRPTTSRPTTTSSVTTTSRPTTTSSVTTTTVVAGVNG